MVTLIASHLLARFARIINREVKSLFLFFFFVATNSLKN